MKSTDIAKDALEAVVETAEALVETDYTPESWKMLQDVLAEAEAVKGTGTISQIEAVQKKVEDALAALGKMPTDEAKTALGTAIAGVT